MILLLILIVLIPGSKLYWFRIINTSYQKLPFGFGDDSEELLFHQALN